MTFIIIFIVVCLLLACVGAVYSRKISTDRGAYYIGGPNGGLAASFFRKHKQANKIYNHVSSVGIVKISMNEQEEQALFAMGVKAIAYSEGCGSALIITPEMCLAYGAPRLDNTPTYGTFGHVYPIEKKDTFLAQVNTERFKEIIGSYTTTTPAKEKSVIGNAVAGAVIAGGVGAVVGAVHAANKNASAQPTTKTNYVEGNQVVATKLKFTFDTFGGGRTFYLMNEVKVSSDLLEKDPELRGYDKFDRFKKIVDLSSEMTTELRNGKNSPVTVNLTANTQ